MSADGVLSVGCRTQGQVQCLTLKQWTTQQSKQSAKFVCVFILLTAGLHKYIAKLLFSQCFGHNNYLFFFYTICWKKTYKQW